MQLKNCDINLGYQLRDFTYGGVSVDQAILKEQWQNCKEKDNTTFKRGKDKIATAKKNEACLSQ